MDNNRKEEIKQHLDDAKLVLKRTPIDALKERDSFFKNVKRREEIPSDIQDPISVKLIDLGAEVRKINDLLIQHMEKLRSIKYDQLGFVQNHHLIIEEDKKEQFANEIMTNSNSKLRKDVEETLLKFSKNNIRNQYSKPVGGIVSVSESLEKISERLNFYKTQHDAIRSTVNKELIEYENYISNIQDEIKKLNLEESSESP